jgi:hypothetical protein
MLIIIIVVILWHGLFFFLVCQEFVSLRVKGTVLYSWRHATLGYWCYALLMVRC